MARLANGLRTTRTSSRRAQIDSLAHKFAVALRQALQALERLGGIAGVD